MARYNAKESEKHWQAAWNAKHWQAAWNARETFRAPNDSAKPKYYALEMFPYPSGRIHIGHTRNYTMGDVIARFRRAQGYNVLHPMGWDAFGLPAENAARAMNVDPRAWTYENIAVMKSQLKLMGLAIDWSREFATCDPDYYKHQQKLFLDFYKAGFVYRSEADVNWDPVDMTVLANEAGDRRPRLALRRAGGAGASWRNGSSRSRPSPTTCWPGSTRWSAGRKRCASCSATGSAGRKACASPSTCRATRSSTSSRHGPTRCSAPASSRSRRIIRSRRNWRRRTKDCATSSVECRKVGTAEAEIETAPKLGYDTGLTAAHPFDADWKLPVMVANFVLMGYGTGAIFGCPAHDQRDLDFARKYRLSVVPVVVPADADPKTFAVGDEAYIGPGKLANSRFLDGMDVETAKREVATRLEARGAGRRTVNYRLRDWLCRASAPGAARSRWCIAPHAASCRCRKRSCRSSCPTRSISTSAAIPWTTTRSGSTRRAHPAALPRCATPTRSTRSWTRRGISRASATRRRRRRSIARPRITGCPSISISAASSTRSCICSMRASSRAR